MGETRLTIKLDREYAPRVVQALTRAAKSLNIAANRVVKVVGESCDAYAEDYVKSLRNDAITLSALAQIACTHPDDNYTDGRDEGGEAWCDACNKVWPHDKGRNDG